MKTPGNNPKIAHAGVGSFGHLAGVLVAQELGVPATQVPYRGAGPALNDLLAGQVDMSSQSAVQSGELVKAGKLKGYAIIGRNRFAGLPDLPTMGELGYKKLDLEFWHMLLAPAGTPRADHRQAQRRAAPCAGRRPGQEDLRRRRHGNFPPDRQTPEAASALAQERDEALGRRDHGQQHHGAVVGRSDARRLKLGARPRPRFAGTQAVHPLCRKAASSCPGRSASPPATRLRQAATAILSTAAKHVYREETP